MKKCISTLILVSAVTLSLSGCGGKQEETAESKAETKAEAVQETEKSEETELKEGSKEESEEESKSAEAEETQSEENVSQDREGFSFAVLKNYRFSFSSGAGAWSTDLTIREDGSFFGEYHDSDMGDTGEGYPDGTRYVCIFEGKFKEPERVNDYTYSTQIAEIHYEKEAGREEIADGVLYKYTDVYGFDDAKDILIYLPGAPLAELPEEFRSWVGYYDLSNSQETELPFYALNNEANQQGFSGYDIIENVRETVSNTEKETASLEESIKNDELSQAEYNEKTQELYEWWDSALNMVWDVLKQTQDAESMKALTAQEREWIAKKEEETAKAGAGYEGGSMQPMAMNQKAADMTKARVYELMKLLD